MPANLINKSDLKPELAPRIKKSNPYVEPEKTYASPNKSRQSKMTPIMSISLSQISASDLEYDDEKELKAR